ncbi:MAG: hypothetical protein NTX25_19120 [Proteobacteria bacterium]|nr:hypothetical protein [Pseudomonadota bacterium]
MEPSSSNIGTKETWWHYEGAVHFIVYTAPFRLLIRARGRRLSHRELIAELDYLEHDFIFSPADLSDMFPVGSTLNLQLSTNSPESGFIVATGEVLQRQLQGHSLQLHLGFKRVDEDLEELLAELGANGGRPVGVLH